MNNNNFQFNHKNQILNNNTTQTPSTLVNGYTEKITGKINDIYLFYKNPNDIIKNGLYDIIKYNFTGNVNCVKLS
jgi:hypothetical protein